MRAVGLFMRRVEHERGASGDSSLQHRSTDWYILNLVDFRQTLFFSCVTPVTFQLWGKHSWQRTLWYLSDFLPLKQFRTISLSWSIITELSLSLTTCTHYAICHCSIKDFFLCRFLPRHWRFIIGFCASRRLAFTALPLALGRAVCVCGAIFRWIKAELVPHSTPSHTHIPPRPEPASVKQNRPSIQSFWRLTLPKERHLWAVKQSNTV